jgi:hypothetical protein
MLDILNILVVLVLTIIGVSFLPSITGSGITPLLSLFFIIGLTYFRRGFGPILLAAISGILMDFFSASFFGFHLGIFLLVAVLIRFLFQEGMKELSFGHYLGISAAALVVYFGLEIASLAALESNITVPGILKPFLGFFTANILCAVLVYWFNTKYFEVTKKMEYYQKRR